MKAKIISLVIAAMLLTLSLAAQTTIGFKGGVNWANFNSDYSLPDNVDNELNEGLSIGIFAEVPLIDNLSFQPELNYLEKGTTFTNDNDVMAQYDLTWGYLEVPLLAKYRFVTPKGNVYFNLGPSFGYAINGKENFLHWMRSGEGGQSFVSEETDYSFRSEFDESGQKDNRFDIGLALGAGGELNIGPGHVLLDVRYGMDFTDNLEFQNTEPAGYEGTFHRDFTVSLGYAFPLGK